MASRFVAAAAQLTAGADLAENLRTCRKLSRDAAARGAALFVLPECFAFVGEQLRDNTRVAEALNPKQPGAILSALMEIAQTGRFHVVAGGMPEWPAERTEGCTPSNTCAVISPAGELIASYQKIHMFDIDIPGRATFRESASTAAGKDAVVVETEIGRLGLSICYDLRFPELYRELALKKGAEILLVPAAFTAHTGAAHWHTLLRARAIENQCYVVAAGQTGRHNEKRESYGHSVIFDPWGDLLAEKEEGVGLAVAEIDLERVKKVREQMPCHSHVRLFGTNA